MWATARGASRTVRRMGDRSSGTATILFTDLVASTDLRSRLGDDLADEDHGVVGVVAGLNRLTAEAARAAHDEGAWVLAGRCDEQVQAPYAPWLEILRHAVAHAGEATLRDHVQRRGGDLGRLVPELGARVDDLPPLRDLDPETERLVVYEAAVDLVVGLVGVAPVFVGRLMTAPVGDSPPQRAVG